MNQINHKIERQNTSGIKGNESTNKAHSRSWQTNKGVGLSGINIKLSQSKTLLLRVSSKPKYREISSAKI